MMNAFYSGLAIGVKWFGVVFGFFGTGFGFLVVGAIARGIQNTVKARRRQ